jgi:hypothetical protein
VSGGYGQATGAGFNSLQPAGSPAPPPPPPPSIGRNEPYFDTLTPRNVTALVGKSAYLTCRVRNLGNKTVSKAFSFEMRIYLLIEIVTDMDIVVYYRLCSESYICFAQFLCEGKSNVSIFIMCQNRVLRN